MNTLEHIGKRKIKIESPFSEIECRQLKLYKERAKKLSQCKIVKDKGNAIHCRINFDKKTGLAFETTLPDENSFKLLLQEFRFFYLNDELTNFNRFTNTIKNKFRDEILHNTIDAYKASWKKALFQGAMNISIKNKELTSSYLFDLWLNSEYFHSDEKKEKELSSLQNLLTRDFCKYMLVDGVYQCTKLVLNTYGIILFLECDSNELILNRYKMKITSNEYGEEDL